MKTRAAALAMIGCMGLLVVVVLLGAGCESGESKRFVGSWTVEAVDGRAMGDTSVTYTFADDGTMATKVGPVSDPTKRVTEKGTWKIEEGKLVITGSGGGEDTFAYEFEQDGVVLKLVDPETGRSLKLQRVVEE